MGGWVAENRQQRAFVGHFFDDFQARGCLLLPLLLLVTGAGSGTHANAWGCTGFTCRNARESIIPFGWVRRWSLLLRREYQQGVVDRSGKALGCPSVERGGDATPVCVGSSMN